MSQSAAAMQPDQYLMQQVAPQQELKMESYPDKDGATIHQIRMVTPIGRFSFAHLDKPHAVQAGQTPKFGVSLLMSPQACGDIWKAICMIAEAGWPENKAEMIADPSTGQTRMVHGHGLILAGRLHSPLRNGDEMFAKKPANYGVYRGVYFINASTTPTASRPAPICYDENQQPIPPGSIYSGCYGRLWIGLATISPKQPTRGITAYLQAVQFARHGEKLAGFDLAGAATAAFGAAGPIRTEPGFGFHSGAPFGGQPGQPAPGGAPPQGFAAPPAGFAAPPAAAPGAPPPGFAAPPAGAVPPGFAPPGASDR
jgi:hypothetical protein